jgi:type III pantothenate kinase
MARHADYLLIDVSNSFTKVAFASSKRVERADRIETARLTTSVLAKYLRRREVGTVVVSSVVPPKNRAIRRAAQGRKVVWVSARIPLGIAVDYPKPLTIGADRLANAAAVAFLYRVPAIVVDFGTAVTFDIVSENKSYIGGVICPGLEAMTNFLYQRTALLPRLSLKEPRRAVGKSTMEAMRSGAIYGYRGLVREIIARICEQEFARKRVEVVGTGGYAQLIARKLSVINRVDPHLTLEGLRIVGNLNR